jgi:hypothetical protein
MKVVFELDAEEQLYDLAELIDDLNISGAGARWINRFLDFIETYAKPNVAYALCRDKKLAAKGYSCITYHHKWVIAFKIAEDEMRICEIIHGSLLK